MSILRILRNRKSLAGLILLALFVFLAAFGPALAPYAPLAIVGKPWLGPSSAHWFGTTQEGYDVWSQFLNGARAIMVISFLSGAIDRKSVV